TSTSEANRSRGHMDSMITNILSGGAIVLTAAAAMFLALGLYQTILANFLTEVREESAGGMKGASTVAIRKMGVLNRKLMWPGYEAKMRRKLVKAGEPSGYKPEDVMALQEIGFVVGTIFGLIVVNFV